MSVHRRGPPASEPSRPVGTGGGPPRGRQGPADDPWPELAGAFGEYRCGASVASVARGLGVSFDAMARLIIAHGVRRDVPLSEPSRRDPPAELDDPDWIRAQLEAGRTTGDIARLLSVDADVASAALTRHGFTVASAADAVRDVDAERAELAARFRTAADRARAADAALDRAVALQAAAVSALVCSGLTIPAVADRLGVDDTAVHDLLDVHRG